MESKIIKNNNFRKIAANIKPDAKKRVLLSKAALAEGVTYHVYCNEIGQIVLDPRISVPLSEAWLYQDAAALKAVTKGLKQATAGKVSKINLKEL